MPRTTTRSPHQAARISLRWIPRRVLHQCANLGADALDHAVPISEARLPKQPRGRIPGRILALEHPAEIGRERQEDPDRFAQRSGEMGNRRIDRNDAIQQREDSGGVREIPEFLAEMENLRIGAKHCSILAAQFALKTHELDIGSCQDG